MRLPLRLLPALFAVACVARATGSSADPALDADVALRERTVEYPVEGRTDAELARALDASAPRIDGRRFRGTTDWRVRWSYRYAPDRGGCAMTAVRVELDLTTTLPRWEAPPDPDPALAQRWSLYRQALAGHEAGHRAYAIRAASEVAEELRGLRARHCGGMTAAANALGRTIVARWRGENLRYDRDTAHGRTQGAGWPPGDAGAGGASGGSP